MIGHPKTYGDCDRACHASRLDSPGAWSSRLAPFAHPSLERASLATATFPLHNSLPNLVPATVSRAENMDFEPLLAPILTPLLCGGATAVPLSNGRRSRARKEDGQRGRGVMIGDPEPHRRAAELPRGRQLKQKESRKRKTRCSA